MVEAFQVYWEQMQALLPQMVESLQETGIMMLLSSVAALVLGLPLGTMLFLTAPNQIYGNRKMNQLGNGFINVIRSFPFLLLVIFLQPMIRLIYGRATGDPVAASFPLMVVAVAIYARFVEQSLWDVPRSITELALSLGASPFQLVWKFLYVEARSSLLIGFTSAFISFLSYSTMMGIVGGGGIGDFAIRYGYQRYELAVMLTAVGIILVFVAFIQWLGFTIARRMDHS